MSDRLSLKEMIRFIAAVDNKLGIANDHGIPWQGRIPSDVAYYRQKMTDGSTILMGYGLYKELSKPYQGSVNYVAVGDSQEKLREGFEPVKDAVEFLKNTKGDVWNAGGALLFASTFELADELYLTQLQADFNCTKFFPEFKDKFELKSESEPITEGGITYTFQVWKRLPKQG